MSSLYTTLDGGEPPSDCCTAKGACEGLSVLGEYHLSMKKVHQVSGKD